jgi:hypothetical protein
MLASSIASKTSAVRLVNTGKLEPDFPMPSANFHSVAFKLCESNHHPQRTLPPEKYTDDYQIDLNNELSTSAAQHISG